jgi:hypothetical protein
MNPERIVFVAEWGTAVFVVSALSAAVFPDALAVPSITVAVTLFALGCLAFVRTLLLAASRSRRETIELGALFFLSGSAPRPVQIRLLGAVAIEVVVALATASARPFTALAFGVLVPVFGLGLCGLWAAVAGTFAPRRS